jgi:hypothetical protein
LMVAEIGFAVQCETTKFDDRFGSKPACAGRPAESRGCKSLTVKA